MNKRNYTLIEQNIYKHNTEQKYVIDIFLGRDDNGKQQRTTKTYYSLKEARKALTIVKAEKATGMAKTKVKTPTIYELMEDYRNTYILTNNEKTTQYGYRVIENHIKAFFEVSNCNPHVDKITPEVVNRYYSYLINIRTKRLPMGMSPNTVRKHNNYLHQLFVYAKKHKKYGIKVNPTEDSTPPKKKKAKTADLSYYTIDKLAELLNCLEKNAELPLRTAVEIGLFVGARRGEINYLKWQDVDFVTKTINIAGCRTCSDIIVEKDTTKTERDRQTTMSDILVNTLKQYKQWQERNEKRLGEEYHKTDYVLVKENGEPYYPRWISRAFPKFLEKYGFKHIRFHDLRHLNASILLTVMPVADVSKHLGHSNTNTTTRIYAHSLMQEQNKVANEMNNIFKAV